MGDTHICLDKQLPCLYPFPQRSQRRSAGARFPSDFMWAPSLARRLWPLGTGLPSWSELLGEGLRATGGSWLGLFMLRDRYELKPEAPPTEVDSSPLRAPRLRRCAAPMGSDAASPPSFKDAATAAAALAAAVVTLLRRVMRWLELTAPSDMEFACCRGLVLGRGRERDNSWGGGNIISTWGKPATASGRGQRDQGQGLDIERRH